MSDIPLKKLTGKRMPTCMMAMRWDGNTISIHKWTLRDKKYCRHDSFETKDVNGLWKIIDDIASKGQMWWIFGWNVYEALCWSGIYEQVDKEGWDLLGAKQLDRKQGRKDAKRQSWGALVCEDVPTVIDVRTPKGARIRFVDLANYGIKPQDFGLTSTNYDCGDVEDAAKAYIRMVNELRLGSLKTTAAAQAMCAFRTNHIQVDMYAHNNEESRRLERDGFFAGRAEAFRLGKLDGGIYHFDVKSMYSYISGQFLFPCRLVAHFGKGEQADFYVKASPESCIARVVISTQSALFPVRYNGRVIYPYGEYETVLCGPELLSAQGLGYIKEVKELSVYHMKHCFTKWSQWYLRTKDSLHSCGYGNLANAFKIMGNTLYGKLGARGKNWADYDEVHKPVRWGQWFGMHQKYGYLTQFRSIKGRHQYLDGQYEPELSMPSISAFMNAYGRTMLSLLIAVACKENVFYVDTDGIMVNLAGSYNLHRAGFVEDGRHGKLVLREESDDVEIFGIKHYRFGDRVCCAGNMVAAHEFRAASRDVREHEPFEHSMQAKDPFAHFYRDIRKQEKSGYRHGQVDTDGIIHPFFMQPITLETERPHGRNVRTKVYEVLGSARDLAGKSNPNGTLQT
jgi:DNA polymerase type B, organellar and viral